MASLKNFLLEKGYTAVPLTLTNTNHFEVEVIINDIQGRFIVDTGASSTCIGRDCIEHFDLIAEDSDIRAAGAGATNMVTQIAKKNSLKIGDWQRKKVKFVLFDLTHVNAALTMHNALPVHGILGADILSRSRSIIDYKGKKLYLKNSKRKK
ncbi:retropepsin-like aspartic protease family protein [Robertkochia aurantiaca]|uniref:retropepsin-like aspartic protease family protein n=1 Tax=Robertkochia aurantiaca TaxID=2873700 RepID=UPI001CCA5362|nr:retropepsin-like aspartic protease [Robertkochia sp. 3YJGBD-33]